MPQIIQIRRDTSANWATVNPVLESAEWGYDTDLKMFKTGDGLTDWNALPFQARPETFVFSLGLRDDNISAGVQKEELYMPFSFLVQEVRATVSVAPTGSTIIVDVNKNGTSILSTKLSIDAGELTSETASVPAVISTSAFADSDVISFDIDQIGATVPGQNLKVYVIGVRT